MAGTIIDGEARPSSVPQLRPGALPLSEEVDARGHLEAALERQTSLREAADRALARAREDHEDAYERLLVRCRALESEKATWIEAGLGSLDDLARIRGEHQDALARQTAEAERVLRERIGEVERHLAHVQREAAHAGQVAAAERDQAAADLAEAEGRFRVEAFRLSAVVALRTKEVEAALARVEEERAGREAAQHQFAAVIASSSWKLGRPMRVLGRALRRILRRGR